MREKLIELIKNATFACPDGITNCHDCEYYEKDAFGNPCNEIKLLADLLIANGVTIPVRCKDCMWLGREDELPDVFRSEQHCYCTEANTYVPINHFCSFGERRTDETT